MFRANTECKILTSVAKDCCFLPVNSSEINVSPYESSFLRRSLSAVLTDI